jgi:hypothetical protein
MTSDSHILLERPRWDRAEEAPPIQFAIHGDASGIARMPSPHDLISSVEGYALRVEPTSLWLAEGGEVALDYALPSTVDLRPLFGRKLRVTLAHEAMITGAVAQTLTIHGPDERVWLLARYGSLRGIAHDLGGVELRAAFSQRAGGPLVIGTRELQWLIQVGGAAWITSGDRVFVAQFLSRSAMGSAAYVVADTSLWRHRG